MVSEGFFLTISVERSRVCVVGGLQKASVKEGSKLLFSRMIMCVHGGHARRRSKLSKPEWAPVKTITLHVMFLNPLD